MVMSGAFAYGVNVTNCVSLYRYRIRSNLILAVLCLLSFILCFPIFLYVQFDVIHNHVVITSNVDFIVPHLPIEVSHHYSVVVYINLIHVVVEAMYTFF